MAIKTQDKQFSLRIRGEVVDELKRIACEKEIHFSTLVRWLIKCGLVEKFKVRV